MRLIILAGGAGTRLWPASRVRRPKQFLRLLGGRTLLAETVARLTELVPPSRILVVANAAHRALVRASVPSGVQAVYEPCGRGTAPGLGLASLYLGREAPGEVAVAVPADNWLAPGLGFATALKAAARLAEEGGLVLVATRPDRPAIEFGYLRPGGEPAVQRGDPRTFWLAGYVEKPSPELAADLCARGWLWNAGVCAFRPLELQREIVRLQPGLGTALGRVEEAWGTAKAGRVLARAWRDLPVLSFERGILARGPRAARVVVGEYGWFDLGNWDGVRRAALAGQRNVVSGDGILCRSKHCLVRAEGGRLVAVVGGEGLTVIETPDAVLVLGPDRGQDVRQIMAFLAACGRADLL